MWFCVKFYFYKRYKYLTNAAKKLIKMSKQISFLSGQKEKKVFKIHIMKWILGKMSLFYSLDETDRLEIFKNKY